MIYEIWDDYYWGSTSLLRRGSKESKEKRIASLAYKFGFLKEELKTELLFAFQAKNRLEACERRNKLLNYGKYIPMTLENGEIDPSYFEE